MNKKALSALIGKNIAYWRKKRNLSQDQLSEALGITKPHLAHVERGERTLRAHRLYDAANILGVSVDSLFYELGVEDAQSRNVLRMMANKPEENTSDIEQILYLCGRLCADKTTL